MRIFKEDYLKLHFTALTLLPLSIEELGNQYSTQMKSRDLIKAKSAEFTTVNEHFERMSKPESSSGFNQESANSHLLKGGYPRLHQQNLDASEYYSNYVMTYLERDVRQIKNILDMSRFERFIRLCAGRSGQILNYSSLAAEAGLSQETVKSWLSLLESSYIIQILRPHHRNFNKRLTKTPKLYFTDTGLACYLLGIRTVDQIDLHPLRGNIFENFVISEMYKFFLNHNQRPNLFFWQDRTHHEIDCIIEHGQQLLPVEIKSGQTIHHSFFDQLDNWKKLSGQNDSLLIYGGSSAQQRTDSHVIPWFDIHKELSRRFMGV